MTMRGLVVSAAILLAAGCVTGTKQGDLLAVVASEQVSTDVSVQAVAPAPIPFQRVTQVDYQELAALELSQPAAVLSRQIDQGESVAQQQPPLTLEALEQMALANSPAIAQLAARVRGLRGKWVQVGLAPNPVAGYRAGEMGNEGAAGQHGVFIGQDFITAGKLWKNQTVVAAEISRAEQQIAITEKRVRTDLRQGYYAALLAQRRVALAEELLRATSEAAAASKMLMEAEEIPLAGLLQTEVQQQNSQVLFRTAQNGLTQAWRQLSVLVGDPELMDQPLIGDVSRLPEILDWQQQLARIQCESPEVAAAMADVSRARRAVRRACVEAVPDINAQVSVQYDDSTDDTLAGVQVGLPLPIWNRNQGGIRQAQAEVTAAVRNVDRIERDLNWRLANAFRQYSDAHITAETYAQDILPRSQRTFELVQQGYAQGEVGYLDLLAAQKMFSQTNLAYLDALELLWKNHVKIEGLMLDRSLAQPPN